MSTDSMSNDTLKGQVPIMRDNMKPMEILANIAQSPWHDPEEILAALALGEELTHQQVLDISRRAAEKHVASVEKRLGKRV